MKNLVAAAIIIVLSLGYFLGVDQLAYGAVIRNSLLILSALYVAFAILKIVAKSKKLETDLLASEKQLASLQKSLHQSEERSLHAHSEGLHLKDELTRLKSELRRQSPHAGAFSLLSLLQEKGRFLDFVMDDVTPYTDQQVGAAARIVQQGCKGVIKDYFEIAPSTTDGEGKELTLDENFDGKRFRLLGSVPDQAPYKGRVIHRGWVAAKVTLPVSNQDQNTPFVLAPAEVEVGALQ